MNNYQAANRIFTRLTTSLNEESIPESLLCSKIKTHILESKSDSLVADMAFAINFVSGSNSILSGNVNSLFEKYVKLSSFIKENTLRFPLEEALIEEIIKLQEDDGGGASPAPTGPVATNNTSGVAKLDYPIGEKPIKRKKDDASDSPIS